MSTDQISEEREEFMSLEESEDKIKDEEEMGEEIREVSIEEAEVQGFNNQVEQEMGLEEVEEEIEPEVSAFMMGTTEIQELKSFHGSPEMSYRKMPLTDIELLDELDEEEWGLESEEDKDIPCLPVIKSRILSSHQMSSMEDVVPSIDDEGRIGFKFSQFYAKRKKLEKRLMQATARRSCGEKGDILMSLRAEDLITGFPQSIVRKHSGTLCAGLRGVTRIRPRLALVPEQRILMRVDHHRLTQVKLVSGGCLGQEPMFTEYVGRGMLTAAVLGRSEVGPTAANVSAALRELYTPRGVLILLHNNSENRLIFGFAMERARVQGMEKIDMIMVGEDCWDRRKVPGGRVGRAGLVLLIKMAGAMAEAGESLKDIYQTIKETSTSALATISAATSPRLLLGGPPINFVGGDEGASFSGSLRDLVKEMLKYPLDVSKYFSLRTYSSTGYVLLINTYKADHWLMYTVVNYAMEEMEDRELIVRRVYGDCFIGGNIPGFSITIMTDFKGCRTQWLDLPTECKIWQQVWTSGAVSVATFQADTGRIISKSTGQMVNDFMVPVIRRAVINACRALIACEQVLNTLHVFSRYGTDLRKGAEAILSAVYRTLIDFRFPFNTLQSISEIIQNNLPGTTGAMYACLFTGAAQPFLKNPVQRAGVASWMTALDSALKTLRAYTDSKDGVVSLVLSIIPLVQTIYGPMTRLNDKELMEGAHPLVLALDRIKAELTERAVESSERKGRRAILANQMDVEQYALVIWLDAVFASSCQHYKNLQSPSSTESSRISEHSSVQEKGVYV